MVYNDFNRSAAESLLRLKYEHIKVYCLDDSTEESVKKRVDAFCTNSEIEVIRRKNREGFKAGAINHALTIISADYVVICDSDEVLPNNFIEQTLPHFYNSNVAFVQATHYAYNRNDTWTRLMGYGVDLHWKHYHHYRNNYGVVNFLGHGAILRIEAVKNVGGFPEIVSEDLGLTIELYDKGYKGIFVSDVRCGETFPENYMAFRKRHMKWSQGSMELTKLYLRKILFSTSLKWYEKLDLVVPMMNLPLVLGLFFFIILSIVFPIPNSIFITLPSLITVVSPMLIFLKMKDKNELFKALLLSTGAFLSLFLVTIVYLLKGLYKADFLTTGEKTIKDFVIYFEPIVGVGFVYACAFTPNLIGIGLLLSPFLRHFF